MSKRFVVSNSSTSILRSLALIFLSLGLVGNARANLYGTLWEIVDKNFTVGSGDYIQMTGNGNGDSFILNNGNFYHNDSTMDFWGNAQIGYNWWANFYQNGGQMNVGGYLSIARYGGSGYLEVNGGTVNSYNHQIIVGEVGTGYMAMKGGYAYTYQGVSLSGNSGSSGTLYLNGGTLEAGAIWKGGGSGYLSLNGGTLKATQNSWDFISGLNSANIDGGGAVIDNNGKGIGINQTLTGNGGLYLYGNNWTTLRQNNTFSGDTVVNGGVLQFYDNGSLYNNGTAAGNIYVQNGASLYFNKQDVFGNADTGSSSPVRITLNGGTINNGGVFNNLANLTMNGGNLNASGGSANGWNAYELNNVTVGGSSASTITSNTSINGNNDILLSRAGTTTFIVGSTGDATGDLKVSAKLTDGNGVVGSLTKTGVGKMVLSAANTYTGETKVVVGTLIVDTGGSIATSSATVSSGATLKVNGLAGAVVLNGILSGTGTVGALTMNAGSSLNPGDTIGKLTALSASFAAGSTYNFGIASLTGAAGTAADLFSVTGALDLSAISSSSKMNLVLQSLSLVGFNVDSQYSWTLAEAGSITGAGWAAGTDVTDRFIITSTGFNAGTQPGRGFNVKTASEGGLVKLVLNAVPEPTTGSLFFMGSMLWAMNRRRRS
ncbi:MAG: PEP-CTERM sorting domain-containing protein [Verrucomicrobia bacterium]|nr:PEP-CTERM sorting domain-containing protein [Verrucomicrobiota bacterium]